MFGASQKLGMAMSCDQHTKQGEDEVNGTQQQQTQITNMGGAIIVKRGTTKGRWVDGPEGMVTMDDYDKMHIEGLAARTARGTWPPSLRQFHENQQFQWDHDTATWWTRKRAATGEWADWFPSVCDDAPVPKRCKTE